MGEKTEGNELEKPDFLESMDEEINRIELLITGLQSDSTKFDEMMELMDLQQKLRKAKKEEIDRQYKKASAKAAPAERELRELQIEYQKTMAKHGINIEFK